MRSNPLYQKDIISIKDLSKDDIELILEVASVMKQTKEPLKHMQSHVLASLFFEPSTRTRLSFESAMYRLSGNVLGFSDCKNTSFSKGETLTDSIRVISDYSDVIVLRHPSEGAARLASEVANVPVINAGDGSNEHPTQTLLDLFSIKECQGKIDELKIAFVGDLKHGRTVHSLALAAAHYNVRMYFISPESLMLPGSICMQLRQAGVKYSFHTNIQEVIPEIDVLYMTRVQKERFELEAEYEKIKKACCVDLNLLKDAKPNLKVMHPLPRVYEIDPKVDQTEHAYYFEQSANGVFVRKALLALLLKEDLFKEGDLFSHIVKEKELVSCS